MLVCFVKHTYIWSIFMDSLMSCYGPVIIQFIVCILEHRFCGSYLYYTVGFHFDSPHLIAHF